MFPGDRYAPTVVEMAYLYIVLTKDNNSFSHRMIWISQFMELEPDILMLSISLVKFHFKFLVIEHKTQKWHVS